MPKNIISDYVQFHAVLYRLPYLSFSPWEICLSSIKTATKKSINTPAEALKSNDLRAFCYAGEEIYINADKTRRKSKYKAKR